MFCSAMVLCRAFLFIGGKIKNSCPAKNAGTRDISCYATLQSVNCRSFLTEDLLRRAYSQKCFPLALKSPFKSARAPQSHRLRLSLAKVCLLLLFFNGFVYDNTRCPTCQECRKNFYKKRSASRWSWGNRSAKPCLPIITDRRYDIYASV